MPDRSSILDLPYILPSQAQKHVTHNEALRRLDVLVQLTVQAVDAVTPPATPNEGDVFALGSSPNGDWAGQDGRLAAWLDGAWYFVAPKDGWRAWDAGAQELRVWNGTDWVAQTGGGSETVSQLGINASADTTNRLSVSADASLFNNAGGGHQLKLNKAAAGDTASLVYQTGFTGHAEMGLAGNNDFSVKVSADGSTWRQALVVDGASGTVSGDAVQTSAADATAARLLTVGAFGLGPQVLTYGAWDDLDTLRSLSALIGNAETSDVPTNAPVAGGAFVGFSGSVGAQRGMQFLTETTGSQDAYFRTDNNGWSTWKRVVTNENMVGTVSQSGGTPTGGVVERGQNADGEYIRFADGTQLATNGNQPIVTAPAPFAGTITKIDGDKLWIGTWF